MSEWKNETILITTTEGYVKLSAAVKDGLAIHQTDADKGTIFKFSLTHCETGALIGAFKTRNAALKCAQQLFPLTDWRSLTQAAAKQIGAKARPIIDQCGGVRGIAKPVSKSTAIPGSVFFAKPSRRTGRPA